ncbi:hypothetical protein [Streptomyces hydrogenans]|uniref:Uncharacterized protein n=1 Tax=Streptomyces hydrogenans TaxID=1873719 RepID=A0ABQ3PJQ3_9ACTN|nr:hypothetical protein [Streptomyces hydrogenans]GHG09710.1 hypothetical protein GCM10018784_22880 [Streptomyces hydrogenans]GHI25260.1 hypothetical protein Shyd_66310 [Streptomyces hydrogenans]
MAALTTQNIVAAGTAPTFGAAAATDYAEVGNGTNTFAVYKNTNASTRTVTVEMDHITLSSGDAYPNKAYTLAATNGELWIPLRKEYADNVEAGVGRAVLLVTPAVADVTVAIVRMG